MTSALEVGNGKADVVKEVAYNSVPNADKEVRGQKIPGCHLWTAPGVVERSKRTKDVHRSVEI